MMLSTNKSLPSNRLKKLNEANSFLIRINKFVDIKEISRLVEDAIGLDRSSSKTKIGRPPYSTDILVRMVILQQLYNLSDEQTEYQCLDRLSFSQFLGIHFGESVPDAKTLWAFKELLKKHNLGEAIFQEVEKQIVQKGYLPRGGQIIDGTMVKAPIQRNTKEENKKIKAGDIPENWSEPQKKQKDTDASWVKKNGVSTFGYKLSANVDNKFKIIRLVHISPVHEHDSQHLQHLFDKRNTSKNFYADSAYAGKSHLEMINDAGCTEKVNRKGTKNKPLTKQQKKRNKNLSKVRCRVEHVFGDMASMGGKFVRCIGLSRAKLALNLKAACYNMRRLCYLKYSQIATF